MLNTLTIRIIYNSVWNEYELKLFWLIYGDTIYLFQSYYESQLCIAFTFKVLMADSPRLLQLTSVGIATITYNVQ